MGVHARQIYIESTVPNRQPNIQPNPIKQKKKKRITAGEKFLYIVFVVAVAVLSVFLLHKQSTIHQTTIEIQEIEKEIATIEKENVGLQVRVNELSTYERIWEKAKSLGLTLKEENVKVVPGE